MQIRSLRIPLWKQPLNNKQNRMRPVKQRLPIVPGVMLMYERTSKERKKVDRRDHPEGWVPSDRLPTGILQSWFSLKKRRKGKCVDPVGGD